MKEFNELVPLDDLNSWFTRPKTMDQKQWAYAQARLTVEYIYDKWGRETIVKMLKMYADNKPTADVIKECLSITQVEFEKKIYDYCMGIAEKIPLGPKFLPDDKEKIEKLLKENPDSPDININYARFLLQTIGPQMKADQLKKTYEDARAHSKKALDAYVKMSHEKYLKRSAIAHGLLAYCDFQNKDYVEARKKCEEALKCDPENFSAHYYLGKLDYLEKKPDNAAVHFEKAKAQYPNMTDIQESLAAIYTAKKDDKKTIENLEDVIKYNNKPYVAAKQLLKLYIKGKQYDDAIRVSDLCLRYNVYDPEVYKLAGDAFKEKNNEDSFKKHYEIGAKIAFEFGMNEVKKDIVRKMLTLGLEMDPSNEKAKELLDKIGGPVKLDETAEVVKPEDPTKLRDEGKGEEKKEEEEESNLEGK
jgi:tetratricopeptide (TPR) repeat protein